jgi:hypothetical protein
MHQTGCAMPVRFRVVAATGWSIAYSRDFRSSRRVESARRPSGLTRSFGSSIDAVLEQLSAGSWTSAKVTLAQAQSLIVENLDKFHAMVGFLEEPTERPGDNLLLVLVHESGANIFQAYAQFQSAAAMIRA